MNSGNFPNLMKPKKGLQPNKPKKKKEKKLGTYDRRMG